ncbi:uncharacterized protein C1orf167 homolog [Echinops telfairi]|uniref:Uncharacterized protein C1orf167 homolog n=1 Tax=Echinops telfairi TaxID=9371 RepID=A0AC55DTR0_ECHTE|nr:uncharacterized protein C1orf167 homolog [Echinops telfairi]
MWHVEPRLVQTNLAGPSPGRGIALGDQTRWKRAGSSYLQQSNLQPRASMPPQRAQQSNLDPGEACLARSGHPISFDPHTLPWGSPFCHSRQLTCLPSGQRQSWPLPPHTLHPAFKPPVGFIPGAGYPWPSPSPWRALGQWTSGPVDEPLALEDLVVSTQVQAQTRCHAEVHHLVASVGRLEHEAARLRHWASQELLAVPTRRQPSLPAPACRDNREKTLGAQASSQPASPKTDSGVTEQGVVPIHPLSQGEDCSVGLADGGEKRGFASLPRGAGLCSPTDSRAAWGIVVPGRKGGARRKEPRTASSCQPDITPQNKAPNAETLQVKTAWRRLLSRCFRAWWHMAQRRRAVAAVEALCRRQLLRKGLRALRWAWHVREAQLEAAWGRHSKVLLARSFQEWRGQASREKQGGPHIPAGPGSTVSEEGWSQGPSSGRKAAGDTVPSSSPGSLRTEEGGQHMGLSRDGRDGGVQLLQALQQLAVFLLWCHQKGLATQERAAQGEAAQVPAWTPEAGQHLQAWQAHAAAPPRVVALQTPRQRAWLHRCFGAWQRFVQRGACCRDLQADRRVGTLNTCLQQWVQMKQLQVSDGVKVTRLLFCRQKARAAALRNPAPGETPAQAPGVRAGAQVQGQRLEQGRGSPQEACRLLALHRVLLLWTTQLSLRQQARDPALLETLQVAFLRAAGQRQQRQCLLFWQAQSQQTRGAARWYQLTLQRRVLLSWSHWTTAQGARRERAAHWNWAWSCRAALGVWRWRWAQWQLAKQWAQDRNQRLLQAALQHWHACWQRHQVLHEKYQAWAQVQFQGLQRTVFWGWRLAAAQQRHLVTKQEQLLLHSHFQGWRGLVRKVGVLRAQCLAFQDSQMRRVLRTMFGVWQEALVAAAQAQGQREAEACQQLRRAWAQRAFAVWRGALDLRHKAHQLAEESAHTRVTLCWMLWVRASQLHQVSRAHAARKLSARVLGAWAQAVVQAHVQLQQAGSRLLLRTYWALWQTALLRVRPEAPAEAKEVSIVHQMHCPTLASRGRPLLLAEAPAIPQASVLGLPGSAQNLLSSQRERTGPQWAQGTASPVPGLPAGQVPGSRMAALGTGSQDRAAGTGPAQVQAPGPGLGHVAAAGPAAEGGAALPATGRHCHPFPGL